MRLVSFNINGIRSRLHQLSEIVSKHRPAVLGLQEIKVADDAFPVDEVATLGYHTRYFGQKGHYGVALMGQTAPAQVQRGFPWDGDDAQRRFIAATYPTRHGTLTVMNGYFPQGEARNHEVKFPGKQRFYADVLRYLREHCDPAQDVVLMGDLNVAPTDFDIGIGEDSRKRWLKDGKCSFLPEERGWFEGLLGWGLADLYREQRPADASQFSWFDYRSFGFEKEPRRGLRIDFILATASVAARVRDVGIDYDSRAMPKPSDHCPVWVDLED